MGKKYGFWRLAILNLNPSGSIFFFFFRSGEDGKAGFTSLSMYLCNHKMGEYMVILK